MYSTSSLSSSSFIPNQLRSFRLIRQLGATHHTQKSVQVQCQANISSLLEKARETLFNNEPVDIILLYHAQMAYEPLETQEQLNQVMKRYKKQIPTLKVELRDDVVNEQNYDMSTRDLYVSVLKDIAQTNDNDSHEAQRILNNPQETQRIYDLYLNSCRHQVPDKLERHTYGIWKGSVERFVRSILIHATQERSKQSAKDRAVFGSSFSLKQVTDELPEALQASIKHVDDNTIEAGPVLGTLTEDGNLRISFVISKSKSHERQMFCSLVPGNQSSSELVKTFPIQLRGQSAEGLVPHTEEVKGLLPNTPYVSIWTGIFNGEERIAQFDTFSGSLLNSRIAAIGSGSAAQGTQLWKELSHERPNLTLHLGSQIDGSIAFKESLKILNNYRVDNYSNATISIDDRNAIREAYRKLYRNQWSDKYVQKALAKRPNLFGFGEGEICSGFGSSAEDSQAQSKSLYIAEQARFVYWEFQRELNDSVFSQYYEDTISSHEARFLKLFDMGVIMLDTVTAKTFLTAQGKENGDSVLGAKQWQYVEGLFGNDLNNTNMLIVSVDSSFMLEMSSAKECGRLLALIQKWKRGNPERRAVILSAAPNGGAEYSITTEGSETATWVVTSAERGTNTTFPSSLNFESQQQQQFTASRRSVAKKSNFTIVDRKRSDVKCRLFV